MTSLTPALLASAEADIARVMDLATRLGSALGTEHWISAELAAGRAAVADDNATHPQAGSRDAVMVLADTDAAGALLHSVQVGMTRLVDAIQTAVGRAVLSECLSVHPLTRDLRGGLRDTIAQAFRVQRYKSGAAVVAAGVDESVIYFVIGGSLAQEDSGGFVCNLELGEWFGESAFLFSEFVTGMGVFWGCGGG